MAVPPFRVLRFAPLLVAVVELAAPDHSQAVEYTVTRIQPPPNAYSAVPTGLNDLGHVVGWSQFFDGSPSLQAWLWTPENGLTYLPPPPGLSRWRAMEINNGDVIAGDEGFDSGQAWRFQSGTYELLGVLSGDSASTAAAINEQGTIVGTSRDAGHFTVPPNAFLDRTGQSMELVLAGGWGTFLNDSGQVVGYASNQAWRFTPGAGVQFLGPLASRTLTWAWSINSRGDVAGEAAFATGNGHVPFLFTDSGGIQEIGNFGGGASATDINDSGAVVGDFQTSINLPWIWTPGGSVRFLGNLIDPSENLNLISAVRINAVGQILCLAFDNEVAAFRPVLLTRVGGNGKDTMKPQPLPPLAAPGFTFLGLTLARERLLLTSQRPWQD